MKDKHGFVLGGFGGGVYKEYELQLDPGAKLFLYTDGVPEAEGDSNEMFGLDRMLNALNTDADAPSKQILENVHSALEDFVKGAERFDDLTMLCVEYKGKENQDSV